MAAQIASLYASLQRCRHTRYTDVLLELKYLGMAALPSINTAGVTPGFSASLGDGSASPELICLFFPFQTMRLQTTCINFLLLI